MADNSEDFVHPMISPVAHYGLHVIARLIPRLTVRKMEEQLFDTFAARSLSANPRIVLFHPARFEKTMAAAQTRNAVTVGIATLPHPAFNRRVTNEEYSVLHLQSREARSGNSSFVENQFHYIIALSDFVKRTYIEEGYPENRIFVAELDVDVDRFAPLAQTAQPETFTVLFPAASSSLRRGLQYLVRAWKQLTIPNKRLIVTGIIDDEVARLINKDIEDDRSIITVGTRGDMVPWFQGSSVVVLPSLIEGFPKSLIEAMACGLPVITTDNAPGLVRNGTNGFIVPIRSPEAIRDRLEWLYHHPEEARAMGDEARRAVENKNPFGQAVIEICEQILTREKRI